MIFLIIFLLFSSLFNFWLLLRIYSARKQLQFFFNCGDQGTRLAFSNFFGSIVDFDLLSNLDSKIFSGIPIYYKENNSKYSSVSDAIDLLVCELRSNKTFDSNLRCFEYVSQIQNSLGLPDSFASRCKHFLANNLLSFSINGTPIAKIDIVPTGSYLDSSKMFYLTSGSNVRLALHPIIFDQNGKILHKSKVFCG